jgi:hypothetical protein
MVVEMASLWMEMKHGISMQEYDTESVYSSTVDIVICSGENGSLTNTYAGHPEVVPVYHQRRERLPL